MSVVAITSSRTSPGATTLAAGLAIAWSHLVERSLLIEADPAGGVLALRFELAPAPSLTSFASDVRNAFQQDLVWSNTQDLRGAHCMPAPVDPRLARSWIERVAPTLNTELPKLGAPTVIDLGWVDEDGASMPLVRAADTTLIVTSPDVAEVQGLLFQIRRLQDAGANVALVTVGSTPNDPQEIATLTGIPLAAVLPDDRQVAAALTGGKFKPNKFRRSLLWRTISGLAESLFDEHLMMSRATSNEVAASSQFPPPVGQPTSVTPPPPPAVAASSATPPPPPAAVPAPPVVAVGAVHAAAADAAWAPGTLDELSPQALANAQPLPPVPVGAQPDRSWNTGNLHEVVAVAHQPSEFVPTPQPDVGHVAPLYISVPAQSHTSVAQDMTPQNAIAPAVVATYISPTPANDNPALVEDTTRMPRPGETVATLVLPNGEHRALDLNAPITIGRHRDCDIMLDDSQVSRQHGRISRTDQGWLYTDLGSRNGTEVNDESCTNTVLLPGDVLTIGRSYLTFLTTSTLEMELA